MNDTNKTAARRTEILAALSTHDDGTGTLGIIVDQALADDPEVTVEEVAAIVAEAVAEAADGEAARG